MAAREWALGQNQNGGGDGRSSLKMDECRERMAVPVVCFRRQYGAFVLLHGQCNFFTNFDYVGQKLQQENAS